MSWFLYLIECADDSVYTGITTDVAARFDEHASGKGARYTRSRKPRAVLASFPLPDRSSASRAEYWVKRLTPAQKRELAAGIRTLESVLPVGMSIDGNIEANDLPAASRGRKKAAKAAKAAKAGNDGTTSRSAKAKTAKRVQSSQAPAKAAAAAAAQRANTGDDAEVNETSPRGAAATQDKPATRAASKRPTQAAGAKPVPKERAGTTPTPARGRASPRAATAEAVEAVVSVAATPGATRVPRTKGASNAAAVPVPARTREKAPARATPRTKQNRAAS
ncbi:GIY-YIG nuclease family protein [Burkholderia latens]|uniref:Excinuclease ABC subunit C n=1 Tax=Burkholderia latens TaxID=488446 RepID=A0A6H9SYG0_9BURK|nr:GIY-YIG nuclease family protein [Burkholderia latens]KAB0637547.1 GIY-YIG nuclease family protein [Burkholderia latens]VWC01581.1 excinuclease ABC subunit C [Burkholderia latens]